MTKNETYISIDVETNGKIPGDFSMLSLGAAAFNTNGDLLSTYYANLKLLPNASEDKDTMEWWSKNKSAYEATRQNIIEPELAMKQFTKWVEKQDGVPVAVCYPSGFDFTWIYWYLIHFTNYSVFSFSSLDIKTYASAMLKLPYRQSTKKNMPKHWFPKDKHTHVALDDAIEQGKIFINMLKENTK